MYIGSESHGVESTHGKSTHGRSIPDQLTQDANYTPSLSTMHVSLVVTQAEYIFSLICLFSF